MKPIAGRPSSPDGRLDAGFCAATTGLIFGQFVALGANTPLLSAIAATAQLALALAVVIASARAAAGRFWLQLLPSVLLLAAATGWALWPLWAPMVGAVQALPGWRASLTPDADVLEVVKLAGAAALGLTTALLARSRTRAIRLAAWLVVAGGLYVVLSLWLWRTEPYSVWGIPKGAHTWSFTATLLNANAAACIFGMISLLALGLTQSLSRRLDLHKPRLRQLLLFGAAVFAVIGALAATALTGSRTSLMLTAILTTILAVTDLGRIRQGARLPQAIGMGALGVILLAVALGVGLAPIAAKAALADEFTSRFSAYGDYLAAAKAAPWSGYGPGSFSTLNAALLPSGLMDDRWSFNAAHCAPLQAALEAGAPFLALLAAGLATAVGQIIRAWLGRGAPSAVSVAALAAAVLAAGCALVDIALNVPAVAAFAAAALGMAWGSSAGAAPPPELAGAGAKRSIDGPDPEADEDLA